MFYKRELFSSLSSSAYRCLILFYFGVVIIQAGRHQDFTRNRHHVRGHHHSTKPPYVDLCDTPEGLEGMCQSLEDCWANDYDDIEFDACDWDTYNDFYCCPHLNAENIRIVSSIGTNRYLGKPVQKPIHKPASNPLKVTHAPKTTRVFRTTKSPAPVVTRSSIRGPKVTTPVTASGTRRPAASIRPTTARTTRSTVSPSVLPHLQQGCGQRYSSEDKIFDERNLGAFVLGGNDAEEYAWPWMVSIHVSKNGGRSRFMCGGSLITNRHVLTAAHCFDDRSQGGLRYLIRFGSNNLTSESGGHAVTPQNFVNVDSIRIHEQYTPQVYYHDIAILSLASTVLFGHHVSPVCLPAAQDLTGVTARAKVTLTGWGHTTYGGSPSGTLREALLQIIPLRRCQQSYENIKTESLSIQEVENQDTPNFRVCPSPVKYYKMVKDK